MITNLPLIIITFSVIRTAPLVTVMIFHVSKLTNRLQVLLYFTVNFSSLIHFLLILIVRLLCHPSFDHHVHFQSPRSAIVLEFPLVLPFILAYFIVHLHLLPPPLRPSQLLLLLLLSLVFVMYYLV
jgi:hypothetical protein